MVRIVSLLALLAVACAPFHPPNAPLAQVDSSRGYRPADPGHQREAGSIWLTLAFSGGGTRAAALAYGILEALRDTQVVVDGQTRRLLDEVDTISGVSGGSFPAAYYGLFGDRIFEEFEPRFLRRNIQRQLVWRTLAPWNLLRLPTGALSRSDLAARLYHEDVFDGATFGDLAAAHGPRIYINATDLISGTTIRFIQGGFDLLCSDLDPFWISYAVAASSAVPLLLSPVTMVNHAGQCGFEPPDWYEEALRSRRSDPRRYKSAERIQPFLDAKSKRYIHLVDGGVSDNLGVRPLLDSIALQGGIRDAFQASGLEMPDHWVLLVVNAENEPDPAISLQSAAPPLAASMNLVSGSQIRRLNFDTLLLAREELDRFGHTLSTPEHRVHTYFVEVGFDLLEDDEERDYFKHLPTSFVLSDEEVDALRDVGKKLLRESPAYQQLLEALR